MDLVLIIQRQLISRGNAANSLFVLIITTYDLHGQCFYFGLLTSVEDDMYIGF